MPQKLPFRSLWCIAHESLGQLVSNHKQSAGLPGQSFYSVVISECGKVIDDLPDVEIDPSRLDYRLQTIESPKRLSPISAKPRIGNIVAVPSHNRSIEKLGIRMTAIGWVDRAAWFGVDRENHSI